MWSIKACSCNQVIANQQNLNESKQHERPKQADVSLGSGLQQILSESEDETQVSVDHMIMD